MNRIDAALQEIVNRKKRLDLITFLEQNSDQFDFDLVESAWGGDH